MAIELASLLPNANHSLDGTCFIFGAGASMEAGYPMMPGLTRQVVGRLSTNSTKTLNDVLASYGLTYDDAIAKPNIEELSDLVIAYTVNTSNPAGRILEGDIKALIVDELLKVRSPSLDNHIKFLNAMRARTFGRSCTVWIVTTNYDLLFESAAAWARVPLVNGFCGATTRYFDVGLFDQIIGTKVSNRFVQIPQLTVKLVKLHGSLSWLLDADANLVEAHPDSIDRTATRAMVLPRRKKVMDTLVFPYDQLFGRVTRAIGTECKYLISCGFSFGDDHINQSIIIPPLKTGRCRLSVLSREEPPGIASFRTLATLSAGFESHAIVKGTPSTDSTECWRFSEFVKMFE